MGDWIIELELIHFSIGIGAGNQDRALISPTLLGANRRVYFTSSAEICSGSKTYMRPLGSKMTMRIGFLRS